MPNWLSKVAKKIQGKCSKRDNLPKSIEDESTQIPYGTQVTSPERENETVGDIVQRSQSPQDWKVKQPEYHFIKPARTYQINENEPPSLDPYTAGITVPPVDGFPTPLRGRQHPRVSHTPSPVQTVRKKGIFKRWFSPGSKSDKKQHFNRSEAFRRRLNSPQTRQIRSASVCEFHEPEEPMISIQITPRAMTTPVEADISRVCEAKDESDKAEKILFSAPLPHVRQSEEKLDGPLTVFKGGDAFRRPGKKDAVLRALFVRQDSRLVELSSPDAPPNESQVNSVKPNESQQTEPLEAWRIRARSTAATQTSDQSSETESNQPPRTDSPITSSGGRATDTEEITDHKRTKSPVNTRISLTVENSIRTRNSKETSDESRGEERGVRDTRTKTKSVRKSSSLDKPSRKHTGHKKSSTRASPIRREIVERKPDKIYIRSRRNTHASDCSSGSYCQQMCGGERQLTPGIRRFIPRYGANYRTSSSRSSLDRERIPQEIMRGDSGTVASQADQFIEELIDRMAWDVANAIVSRAVYARTLFCRSSPHSISLVKALVGCDRKRNINSPTSHFLPAGRCALTRLASD
ncbi:unnamed protein product [Calicophoron daubneyi]|uniref:Uncharacterized protein n=1 Tax=Calicophoron daubneyi TaxID=300641 RepID=A0AAV2T7R4_CALDB